jgi:hypothetical protein
MNPNIEPSPGFIGNFVIKALSSTTPPFNAPFLNVGSTYRVCNPQVNTISSPYATVTNVLWKRDDGSNCYIKVTNDSGNVSGTDHLLITPLEEYPTGHEHYMAKVSYDLQHPVIRDQINLGLRDANGKWLDTPALGAGAAAASVAESQPTILQGLQLDPVTISEEQEKLMDKFTASIDWDFFRCPITRAFISDPVIASDGHTYEKAAIEAWINRQRGPGEMAKSPLNDAITLTTTLTSNLVFRAMFKAALETLDKMVESTSVQQPNASSAAARSEDDAEARTINAELLALHNARKERERAKAEGDASSTSTAPKPKPTSP